MSEQQVAPYGAWKSPITPDLVVQGSLSLGQIVVDGDAIYWAEGRPAEKGRTVIMRANPHGEPEEITPANYYVRTRVHEYGGGAYTVIDGTVYFSNDYDGRLYKQPVGGEPTPLSPAVDLRYADFTLDKVRDRFICVREDHTEARKEAGNTVVAMTLTGESAGTVLVEGDTFYSNARVSPNGKHLCWLAWNHPHMPWDGTELWVGEFEDDGTVGNKRLVAGGGTDAVYQPEWSPDGKLYFVSDRTGWWNLYRITVGGPGEEGVEVAEAEALHPMKAEFGRPQWIFGGTVYGFESSERIICTYIERGIAKLASLNTETLEFTPISTPYTSMGYSLRALKGRVVMDALSPTVAAAIVVLDLGSGEITELRRSSTVEVDSGYISVPQAIEYPTEGGKTAHGFFYPPSNKDYTTPADEKPPLIVIIHGGPTSQTVATRSLGTQFWTSRGFGILDVNYGGSTGYGTEYRRRLNGQWGVVDVDDCVNGAQYLAEQGLADADRLIIRGGSAGGYTTLAALTFRDTFKAGASYFGISDLETMAQDTHKFESRYLDSMVGPYPEERQKYIERSAIHQLDRLNAAVIFFQGLEDKVVPPAQSEKMADALREKGVPVAYIAFEGEQHGFRKSETIVRTLQAELYFYSRVFHFTPADDIEPVEIDNLVD